MNIKSVFVFFVIECQLVRAAAVICRGIACEPLRFVYVAEASKRYSYCIYCLWKYHHILSRKKCLSIIRFAPGHRVVRCQYARLFPVKLCRLSCDNSVDQRGGILIFSFCVCIRQSAVPKRRMGRLVMGGVAVGIVSDIRFWQAVGRFKHVGRHMARRRV